MASTASAVLVQVLAEMEKSAAWVPVIERPPMFVVILPELVTVST